MAAPSASPAGKGASRKSKRWWWITAGVIAVGIGIGATVMLAGGSKGNRPDLLLHTVGYETIDLTIIERGTLESAENKEVTCKVKALKGGNFATTIIWVIDDGSPVNAGQHICTLDSAALKDQQRTQIITLRKAEYDLTKAETDAASAIKENEEAILKATNALRGAELDLEKYIGLPRGTLAVLPPDERQKLIRAVEKDLDGFLDRYRKEFPTRNVNGEYHQLVDDVNGRIETAEAEFEQWKDKAAYSQRMVIKGYVTQSQAQSDESRLNSAGENLKKLRTEKRLLQSFVAQKTVLNFCSLLQEAEIALVRTSIQTKGKAEQTASDRDTKLLTVKEEKKRLEEIAEQIEECRILAPQKGMVVYYVSEQSRFGGGSQQSIVAQGEPVRENQKLMRIPNLEKMQVVARVHEATISRIKGDEYEQTGFSELLQATSNMNKVIFPLFSFLNNEEYENSRHLFHDYDFIKIADGQPARVKVDAFSEKPLKGQVKSVAAVASQDFFTSDVKVYQTTVSIDELPAVKPSDAPKKTSKRERDKKPSLRPGMSAEVTIQVENPLERVLAIPVQAILGGPEQGDKRKIYVMTSDGPQEREIRIGMANDKMAEVRDGLKEGDQVVTNPKVILGDKAKTRETDAAKDKGKTGGKGKGGPPGK